jgi:hypothetical protein
LIAHELGIHTIAQTVQSQLLNFANAHSTIVGDAHMHVCFKQGFGHSATAFARESNDGHVAFMGCVQCPHQALFFTVGGEQQKHITGLAQGTHLPGQTGISGVA